MTVLSRARTWLRAHLIEDAHRAWRFASVQIAASGAVVLTIWNEMPQSMRDQLPPQVTHAAPIVFLVAAIAGRIFQAKPDA